MEELGELGGEEGQGTCRFFLGQLNLVSLKIGEPIEILRTRLHNPGVHVNGDHPHLHHHVLIVAAKEVHYMRPADVHFREHENVAWEVLRGVPRPELLGGDRVVLVPLHGVQREGVAGDGEATGTGSERPVASAVVTRDVDELELSAADDVGRATVQPARWFAPDRRRRELVRREAEEGDGRVGISEHVAEEDATVVVDPAQPAVDGDDGVGLLDPELPGIIRAGVLAAVAVDSSFGVHHLLAAAVAVDSFGVLAEAADWYAAGVPFALNGAGTAGYIV